MNATFLLPVSKGVSRHPRKALAVALFALRHQRRLRAVNRASQRASQSAAAARRVAGNRKVRKETRLALSAMTLASERALRIGLVGAPRDKEVASHLRHAGQHVSKAITIAERVSRNRRSVRETATITIGAGALGGAAYAGWKMYGRPEPSPAPSPISQTTPGDVEVREPVPRPDGADDSRAAEPS